MDPNSFTRTRAHGKSAYPAAPSYLDFDKGAYAWRDDIDYRACPDLYRVGKGEQGVLIVEPYKSEILPLWRFKTEDIARTSAESILEKFRSFMTMGDFVGADMARKFLQMGFTRARRYAKHKGGRKFCADSLHAPLTKGTGDPMKARAAQVFYDAWQRVEADADYATQKRRWKQELG